MSLPTDPPTTPQRGVLFADVADSSRLVRELGDDGAREVILRALELARGAVEDEAGRVVEVIGDEVFCLFPDADSTLRAALEIQSATARAREEGELPATVFFRIGLTHGPVGLRGADVFGDTVYMAKRVSTAAKAEQILTTAATLQALCDPDPEGFCVVETLRLKGRIEEVELVEALWGTDITLQSPSASARPQPCRADELRLSHAGREIVVSPARPSVTLGRGATCDFRIENSGVSRLHARVRLGREGFGLVDLSRNGTILSLEGASPRTVTRSSSALTTGGTLQLGSHEGAPVVTYTICAPEG